MNFKNQSVAASCHRSDPVQRAAISDYNYVVACLAVCHHHVSLPLQTWAHVISGIIYIQDGAEQSSRRQESISQLPLPFTVSLLSSPSHRNGTTEPCRRTDQPPAAWALAHHFGKHVKISSANILREVRLQLSALVCHWEEKTIFRD